MLNSQGSTISSLILSHSLCREDSSLGINCVLKDTGIVCLWNSSIISYRNWRMLDKAYMRQKDALRLRQVSAIVDNCFCSCFCHRNLMQRSAFHKAKLSTGVELRYSSLWKVWADTDGHFSQKCWASTAPAEIRGSRALYRKNAMESCGLQEVSLRWNWCQLTLAT